jgi:hypothetical protein
MTTSELPETAVRYGLTAGTPRLASIGPIAFGPDGILFVADNQQATIFAIGLGDSAATTPPRPINLDQIDVRLAAYLGCSPDDVVLRDLAVHPTSAEVYLAVMRGNGAAAMPVLIKLDADGTLAAVSLENVPCAQTSIEDAPAADDSRLDVRVVLGNREGEEIELRNGARLRIARETLRTVTVTDMAYVAGTLLVAGASNEEFSSTLRRIPFPFDGAARSNSVEIYHVSHGKYETASPIRTFVPYGDGSILASYTCTPVVQLSLAGVAAGSQVKGRTVAELGAGNTPLDMVAFERDGEEYLLVSNSRHPLMKIPCKNIGGQEGLTEPREPVGVPRETLPQGGVSHMANLNGSQVLMLQLDEDGHLNLRSYDCAAL